MTKKLTEYSVLTFDCYGTMIDWESGIWDALQRIIWFNNRDDITREIALAAFAEIETEQERATPAMRYDELLTQVHRRFAERFELQSNQSLDARFGDSVPDWPAFADSADALRALRKQFKLVILSNVHRAGFAASNEKLGVEFDAIYTAEDIGTYKPDANNFNYLLEHIKKDFNIDASEILHTAQSMHHDHVPATAANLARAWIDRQDLANSDNWGATAVVESQPEVDFRFMSLAEMALAVEADQVNV